MNDNLKPIVMKFRSKEIVLAFLFTIVSGVLRPATHSAEPEVVPEDRSAGAISPSGNLIARVTKADSSMAEAEIFRFSPESNSFLPEAKWMLGETSIPETIIIDEHRNLLILLRYKIIDLVHRELDIISVFSWKGKNVSVSGITLKQLEKNLDFNLSDYIGDCVWWSNRSANAYDISFRRHGVLRIPAADLDPGKAKESIDRSPENPDFMFDLKVNRLGVLFPEDDIIWLPLKSRENIPLETD